MADVETGPDLWQDSGSAASLCTARNIDVQKMQLIAACCHNGSVFPSSPAEGQWFLFEPGSRRVLHQYVNGVWWPMMLFGDATIVVYPPTGNDATGNGEWGAPYATVQKAADQVPPICAGNVTILATAGTYAGGLSIGGKSFTSAAFTITIAGAYATQDATVLTAGGGQGNNGSTLPSVVAASWPAIATRGSLLIFTSGSNNGTTKAIGDVSGTTLTLCGGQLAAAPAASDTVAFMSLATIISGTVTIAPGQSGVVFNDVSFTGAVNIYGSGIQHNRCTFNRSSGIAVMLFGPASATFYICGFKINDGAYASGIQAQQSAFVQASDCAFAKTGSGTQMIGIRLLFNSSAIVFSGTVFYGLMNGVSGQGSTAVVRGLNSHTQFRSCTNGLNGEQALLLNPEILTEAQYSGNTTDIVPLLIASTAAVRRTTVADVAYTAKTTDDLICYTSLTASRIVTLPTAASAGAGKTLTLKDESGAAAVGKHIQLNPAGSETIDGQTAAAGGKKIVTPYGAVEFYSTGTVWFVIGVA